MAAPPPVLDHVVIDVRDRIDEAARCFTSLGFQLTPRGRHTLGSVNHLAMFATDYLELLGFAAEGATRAEIMRFPLGLNGLVFKAADADAVYRQAAEAGLPVLPVQSFSRPVVLDGATHDARFRTTRLDPAGVPMGRVYFCEHLTSELVWRREWQAHPNGASMIARVLVSTPDPQKTARLFRGLFGDAAVANHGTGQIVRAGAAEIELSTPDAVAAEFGTAAAEPAGRTEYLAALGIRVRSLAETEQCLRSVEGLRIDPHRVVVPAAAAFNTALVFAE
ncbi:MAG: VOC family protein [Alphaproteobacteria bacterium]|nr:VOC family protein [Alphaproteobacteria bacterium]